MLERPWGEGSPRALLVGMEIGAAIPENRMEASRDIKNETTVGPSNSTAGYFSKENGNTISKTHMRPRVRCRTIYSSRGMRTTRVSADGCLRQEIVIQTRNEILWSHKHK